MAAGPGRDCDEPVRAFVDGLVRERDIDDVVAARFRRSRARRR
jgi:hypothetical protein